MAIDGVVSHKNSSDISISSIRAKSHNKICHILEFIVHLRNFPRFVAIGNGNETWKIAPKISFFAP